MFLKMTLDFLYLETITPKKEFNNSFKNYKQ
jgi:hypothetical protein